MDYKNGIGISEEKKQKNKDEDKKEESSKAMNGNCYILFF